MYDRNYRRARLEYTAIPTVRSRSRAEGLPLCMFRKSMGTIEKHGLSDPRYSPISQVGPLSRPATSAKSMMGKEPHDRHEREKERERDS